MERCSLREGPDQWRLDGTVLTLLGDGPAEIRYAVTCDRSWRTRSCTVHVDHRDVAWRVELEADGTGSWSRDGTRVDALDGITDADLGFSPCTNTIPVRRLAPAIGEEVRITVVWLRFPEFDLLPSEQAYTRIAENRYRFESGAGEFRALIEIDRLGIVTRYGEIWREVRQGEAEEEARGGRLI
jgi:hypothetical protein